MADSAQAPEGDPLFLASRCSYFVQFGVPVCAGPVRGTLCATEVPHWQFPRPDSARLAVHAWSPEVIGISCEARVADIEA